MASVTAAYMTRARIKKKNMGKKRKARLEHRGTTLSKTKFFGDKAEAKS